MQQQFPTGLGPIRQRGRVPRFACPICNKVFITQETLNIHLVTHRPPTKPQPRVGRPPQKSVLSFKCALCNAQYPSQEGLDKHKMTYHSNAAQGTEMVCPVVDLKQPGVISKLSSLGISHCVVLSQLSNQPNGIFGLPIVSIDSANNPAQSNSTQGPPNVCSLGPPKPIKPPSTFYR